MKKLIVHAIIENTIHFSVPEDRALVALTIPDSGFNGLLTSIYYQTQALAFLQTATELMDRLIKDSADILEPVSDNLVAVNKQVKEYLRLDADPIIASNNVVVESTKTQNGGQTKITIPQCGVLIADTAGSETVAALIRLLLDSKNTYQSVKRATPWIGGALNELKLSEDERKVFEPQFLWAINHTQFDPVSIASGAQMLRIHDSDVIEEVNGTLAVNGANSSV